MDIDTIVEEKLQADTDFQSTLEGMSDEDKNSSLASKRSELVKSEFKAIADAKEQAEKVANNQKIRAEKAEGERDRLKPKVETKVEPEPSLSATDIIALSKVHEDDIERVTKFAKDEKLSIKEALKSDDLNAILERRAELRKTANASNTRGGRPSVKAPSGDELQKDLSEGKVPEKGSKEADELFWARRGGKR